MRRFLRAAFGLAAAAGLWGAASPASGQQVSAAALKAAFLLNFAKFATWPDDVLADGQPITFCVVGDQGVADALLQSMKGHSGNPFIVSVLKPEAPLRECQVLFIGGTDARQVGRVLAEIKGAPVFTVGESERFAEYGGVAQLVQDHGRMRFAINPAAAQRARLVLSAKLLNLAILVKEGSDATR
jgi:hypothetical protein